MKLIKIPNDTEIPLIGLIHIGIIDRGSNLLQIRPTTICNLKCQFCSTSSGEQTEHCKEKINFIVTPEYLINYLKHVIKLKQINNIEANIDSVGEPTTYPYIITLIKEIKKLKQVKFISMQTNGTLLNKTKITQLEKAGLNRINLSIHSLDEKQAKDLANTQTYNIKKLIQTIEQIKKSKIKLQLTPVYLPNINDKQIPKLINLAKDLNIKILIQKYETYKYSRKLKKAKRISWYKFYKKLEQWEEQFNIKLKYGPKDLNIHRTKKIPLTFNKNQKITAEMISPGWHKNQVIARANNRAITILDQKYTPNKKIKIKITENKNSIYIAKKS